MSCAINTQLDKCTAIVPRGVCYKIYDAWNGKNLFIICVNYVSALDWAYRRKLILQELKHYSADIISLQEVETDQFYNYFLPELQLDGYAGIFAAKSRAKTMNESDRKFVDGCAIFYRTNKFKLIKVSLGWYDVLVFDELIVISISITIIFLFVGTFSG